MLNAKAINLLANQLAPTVAEKLFASEAWVEFLQSNLPSLIDTELGECDEDLLFELSLCVMDRLSLKAHTF